MERRFVVHVGAPKTGTTAFQEWAVNNRAALLEAGYLYPETGATQRGNHAALVSALGGAIEDAVRTAHLTRAFEEEMRRHPGANVIISAEIMTSLRYLPHMKQLHQALAAFGGTATIVQVVRDQISWRNSCYAQAREMLTPLPSFREYASIGRIGTRIGNWNYYERSFRGSGFDYQPLAFNEELRRKGIVAAMAELPCLAGLNPLAADSRQEVNASASDAALLVAEQVRTLVAGPGAAVRANLRPRLMAIVADQTQNLPGTSFNGFDEELAATFRAGYRRANQMFARRHFGRDWDDLFPPVPITHVSVDDFALLPPQQQRRIRAVTGRVLIEAIETGILGLTMPDDQPNPTGADI